MKGWMSQIVIGIIVTVVGTVIANAIINGKGGKGFFGGGHYGGPSGAGASAQFVICCSAIGAGAEPPLQDGESRLVEYR